MHAAPKATCPRSRPGAACSRAWGSSPRSTAARPSRCFGASGRKARCRRSTPSSTCAMLPRWHLRSRWRRWTRPRSSGHCRCAPPSGTENYLSFSAGIEHPESGEVTFADAQGQAHARRWTHRQSGLSAIRDETASVLIVMEGVHASAAADVQDLALGAWPARSTRSGASRRSVACSRLPRRSLNSPRLSDRCPTCLTAPPPTATSSRSWTCCARCCPPRQRAGDRLGHRPARHLVRGRPAGLDLAAHRRRPARWPRSPRGRRRPAWPTCARPCGWT